MQNDSVIYLEQLITGHYVKYNRLSELISMSYAGSDCTEVNLFIDLHSVLKQMYSLDYAQFRSAGEYDIVAAVINMCAHYRGFFRSLGVNTTIYLIYGINCPEINSTFVKGYNNKFVTSYIKKPDTTTFIESNLEILNIICQYLPKIYFFNIGTCEVSSMIDYIINITNATKRGIENIIITKDVLALQLIPEHNARVIRPVKTKEGDQSFIVDNNNLYYQFITQYRKGSENTIQIIPTTFFQNVLSMTKVPERSMYSALRVNKVFQVISVALQNGFLEPNKLYTQSTINTIFAALDVPTNQFNPIDLEMRFKAINTHFQSTYVLPIEKPEFKRLRIVDLEDVTTLKNIINRYFINTPIDLDRL